MPKLKISADDVKNLALEGSQTYWAPIAASVSDYEKLADHDYDSRENHLKKLKIRIDAWRNNQASSTTAPWNKSKQSEKEKTVENLMILLNADLHNIASQKKLANTNFANAQTFTTASAPISINPANINPIPKQNANLRFNSDVKSNAATMPSASYLGSSNVNSPPNVKKKDNPPAARLEGDIYDKFNKNFYVYLHISSAELNSDVHDRMVRQGLRAGASEGIMKKGKETEPGTIYDPDHVYVLSGSNPKTTSNVLSEVNGSFFVIISTQKINNPDFNYKINMQGLYKKNLGAYSQFGGIASIIDYPASKPPYSMSIPLSNDQKQKLAHFIQSSLNMTPPVSPGDAVRLIRTKLEDQFGYLTFGTVSEFLT